MTRNGDSLRLAWKRMMYQDARPTKTMTMTMRVIDKDT